MNVQLAEGWQIFLSNALVMIIFFFLVISPFIFLISFFLSQSSAVVAVDGICSIPIIKFEASKSRFYAWNSQLMHVQPVFSSQFLPIEKYQEKLLGWISQVVDAREITFAPKEFVEK